MWCSICWKINLLDLPLTWLPTWHPKPCSKRPHCASPNVRIRLLWPCAQTNWTPFPSSPEHEAVDRSVRRNHQSNKTRWWQLKCLLFSPRSLGKMIQGDSYFLQMGWNHQLEKDFFAEGDVGAISRILATGKATIFCWTITDLWALFARCLHLNDKRI